MEVFHLDHERELFQRPKTESVSEIEMMIKSSRSDNFRFCIGLGIVIQKTNKPIRTLIIESQVTSFIKFKDYISTLAYFITESAEIKQMLKNDIY